MSELPFAHDPASAHDLGAIPGARCYAGAPCLVPAWRREAFLAAQEERAARGELHPLDLEVLRDEWAAE